MKRSIFFIGATLLTLAITGTMFAFAVTADTDEFLLGGGPDFAKVEPIENNELTWFVFGSYTGAVAGGDLFTITPEADWNGDMSVVLTIVNGADLATVYRTLILEIEVCDVNESIAGTTEYLTLSGGEISIEFEQTGSPYTVKLLGGYYTTHREGWDEGLEGPTLLCRVLQR